MESSKVNEEINGVGVGRGGYSHTQRIINFGTTAVSSIHTLTINFFCFLFMA